MTESLKQISKRISQFLLFAVVVAVFGHDGAHGQQTNIQGNNVVLGTWDASDAARTNPSRTGIGSPVGRDGCLRAGESFFQTNAVPGLNNWYCTAAGYPGSWTNGNSGGSGTVTSLSASCQAWLACPIATPTTTPALTIGAATGQTSHQVIGTCGLATSFGPCSLTGAELPNPGASSLGGVESYAAVSHQWINAISTSGVPASTQPACGDLSNAATSCSTDATNASNISSGTLGAARLPNPTASTLGGVESIVSASHNWISYIDTSGVPHQSQPACGDLSNAATSCSTDATNASNISTGTLGAARLPSPAGGGPAGGVAAITTGSGAITTTETSIVAYTVPANTITAGTTYHIKAYGVGTSSAANTSDLRVRFGPNGSCSSSDTNLGTVAVTAATSGTNITFSIEFLITFQSTTVSEVAALFLNNGSTGIYTTASPTQLTPTNTTGLTTTANEILEFCYVSSSSTTSANFGLAEIDIIKP